MFGLWTGIILLEQSLSLFQDVLGIISELRFYPDKYAVCNELFISLITGDGRNNKERECMCVREKQHLKM